MPLCENAGAAILSKSGDVCFIALIMMHLLANLIHFTVSQSVNQLQSLQSDTYMDDGWYDLLTNLDKNIYLYT